MALCKRVVKLVADSGVRVTKFQGFNLNYSNTIGYRQISQLVKSNGKRAFLVDTLQLVLYFLQSHFHFLLLFLIVIFFAILSFNVWKK